MESEDTSAKLEWVAEMPLRNNTVVIRQLTLVFAVALGFLFVVLLLADWPPDAERLLFDLKIVGIVTAVVLVLLAIALVVTFAGGYEMEYRLNDRGIGGRTHGHTARRNKIVGLLLLLSGRPMETGAGLLSLSRQMEYVAWKDVQRAEANPRSRLITLKGRRRTLMVVACDEAHYDAVLREVQAAVARNRKH